MFIVLEGHDGSGKSTLCPILAKKLNAIAYATPQKKFTEARYRVDRNASPEEHYAFYRNAIYEASAEIKAILERGENIVSDRYWLTTYIYHAVKGVAVRVDDFKGIILPDLTILLSVSSSSIQKSRVLAHGMSIEDQKMSEKQQTLAVAYYETVLKLEIPFLAIDTEMYSADECATVVETAAKVLAAKQSGN